MCKSCSCGAANYTLFKSRSGVFAVNPAKPTELFKATGSTWTQVQPVELTVDAEGVNVRLRADGEVEKLQPLLVAEPSPFAAIIILALIVTIIIREVNHAS